MKKSFLSFLLILAIIQIQVQTLTSCANIIPPTGGPRDSLPPVLVKADPADSTLNFTAKKITLSFDEYVQLDNQAMQNNLVVSPNPEQMPIITSHLKDVTIRIKDTLRPNTTYAIDFGNALKDNNEGNPYKNFTYVFSTGNSIVDGELSGRVQLSETGATDSTLIVILHKNLNDTAIQKLRPDYYTRLDSAGRFHFRYVAYGQYAVYVLPNDYTKKYDDSTKMFAFLNEPVTISDTNVTGPVMMYAYNEYRSGENTNNFGESSQSNNNSNRKKAADTTIKYSTSLEGGEQDLLSDLSIQFPQPVAQFDSAKISLTDTNYNRIPGYKIYTNTAYTNFRVEYPWKEGQFFKLVIQKDAFVDSTGKMLAKIDTLSFQTSSESSYGSILLNFINLDLNRNPVLQFVQSDKIVDSFSIAANRFYRKLYKPGDYQMRILYDDDKNLTWTPGSFALKRQPEIVINIPKRLTIKKNWDNEANVNL